MSEDRISFENARDVAQLRPADIAKSLRLSRVTVSFWFNGHTQPHRLLTDRVKMLLDCVDRAIEAGELPVPAEVTRRERGLYIAKVLAKHNKLAAQ